MVGKTAQKHKFTVIGAGILGLTCAFTLARRFGQGAVQIIDFHGFGADNPNASFLAGGMIAPYAELDHMPQTYVPAGLSGIDFWAALSKETGDPFEFTQSGSLLLAHESDRHLLTRFSAILPPDPVWQNITGGELQTLEPDLAQARFSSGIHIHGEAHLHPQKLLRTLGDMIENKHIRTVRPKDEAMRADWVIDCRGMGAANDDPELRGVKGETLIVRNPAFTLLRPVRLMHPRYPLYIIPRADNIFMIGATIIESSGENTVSLRSGLELMSALYSLHPSFADAEIISLQSGIRPAYPDNLPRITVQENIIRCNGLYRHGYLLSPAMADCVTSHVTDENSEFKNLFLKENTNGHYSERAMAHG
jgi:glycine oxidase